MHWAINLEMIHKFRQKGGILENIFKEDKIISAMDEVVCNRRPVFISKPRFNRIQVSVDHISLEIISVNTGAVFPKPGEFL